MIAGEAAVTVYLINPQMSRFTVRAYAGGFLSGFGHNPVIAIRDLSGEVHTGTSLSDQASVTLKIRADSLTVENDMSEKDRREMLRNMQQDVLETGQYPEIAFASTSISAGDNGRFQIDGNLTLHGVTRPHRMAAQVAMTGDIMRAFGEFTILQNNYRIKLASVAGGALKLKDELKFDFDIVSRRKAE